MEILKVLIPLVVLVGIFFLGTLVSKAERDLEKLKKETDMLREYLEKFPLGR